MTYKIVLVDSIYIEVRNALDALRFIVTKSPRSHWRVTSWIGQKCVDECEFISLKCAVRWMES